MVHSENLLSVPVPAGRTKNEGGGERTQQDRGKWRRNHVCVAEKHGKPCLHLSRDGGSEQSAVLKRFVAEHGIKTLNVAGSRESKEPGLHDWVMQVLEDAFFRGPAT